MKITFDKHVVSGGKAYEPGDEADLAQKNAGPIVGQGWAHEGWDSKRKKKRKKKKRTAAPAKSSVDAVIEPAGADDKGGD